MTLVSPISTWSAATVFSFIPSLCGFTANAANSFTTSITGTWRRTVNIFLRESMSMLAVCSPRAGMIPRQMLCARDFFEVSWIAARAILAHMMQRFSGRNCSGEYFVDSSMSSITATMPIYPAIPVAFCANPVPTFRDWIDDYLSLKPNREIAEHIVIYR